MDDTRDPLARETDTPANTTTRPKEDPSYRTNNAHGATDDIDTTHASSRYNPEYAPKEIPIVDAALLYQAPFNGKETILVICNALYVKSMQSNLMPPFIMREHGVKVYDTAKIHISDPDVDDHAIIIEDHLRIPLQLHGTFSYFQTRKPTLNKLNENDDVYTLTPEHFNPHNDAYARNEALMLDWDGNMINRSRRQQVLLSDVRLWNIAAQPVVSEKESKVVDKFLFDDYKPATLDQTDPIMDTVSPILTESGLANRLAVRAKISSMMTGLGSCNANATNLLLPCSASASEELPEVGPDELYHKVLTGLQAESLSHDNIFVSAATAQLSRGVSPKHLS